MILLLWAQRVEAQSVQREALDSIKEAKDFEIIRLNIIHKDKTIRAIRSRSGMLNCIYCRIGHLPETALSMANLVGCVERLAT